MANKNYIYQMQSWAFIKLYGKGRMEVRERGGQGFAPVSEEDMPIRNRRHNSFTAGSINTSVLLEEQHVVALFPVQGLVQTFNFTLFVNPQPHGFFNQETYHHGRHHGQGNGSAHTGKLH